MKIILQQIELMEKIDWFHQNSIFYDETDESIIISGRNQDIVMKLDYKTESN